MVFPLPAIDGGISKDAIPEILRRMQSCDAVLIGPGLGRGAAILPIVRTVLETATCPVILDADGINCLQGQEPQASSPFLTPTAGSLQSWDRRVRPRLV